MIGEEATWNRGQAPGKSSLRQTILPVAASRHESVPVTPRVTTFPLATAGELRGPGCCPASGPEMVGTGYLSAQSSLPVPASRQRVTSSPSCREKTYNLSPTNAGDESAPPTLVFHFWVSSLGQVFGAVN